MMIAMIAGGSLLFLGLVTFFLNEFPLFLRESADYSSLPEAPVMDPRAEPIIRQTGRKGCFLLVHGFPSTPALYRRTAEQAEAAGYDVLVPLLPGCGTDPEIFKKTTFPMWYQFLKDLYLRERGKYEVFHVVGSSMGGALTLTLAAEFSGTEKAPTTITTAAAPTFINSLLRHRVLHAPALYLVRFVSWLTPFIPPGRDPSERPDVDGDSEWVGYHGIFTRQVYSLKMGLFCLRRRLKKISVPLFALHSRGDKTVPFENLWNLAKESGSAEVRTRALDLRSWNHSRHSLFLYRSIRDELFEDVLAFARHYEEKSPVS